MSITIEGLKDIEDALNRTRKTMETEIMNALNSVLSELVTFIKKNGPWNDITGNLRNSVDYVPAKKEGEKIFGYIRAGMEYAVYVEFKNGYWVISGALTEYKDKIISMLSERVRAQFA